MQPSTPLQHLRSAISSIDNDVLALLAKRKQLALDVARSKIVDERPIRDIQREKELLSRLVAQGREQGLDAHLVLSLYQTIIEDSVLNQQAYLQQLRNPDQHKPQYSVAYLGTKGSYSHLAANRYCQRRQVSMLDIGCANFKEIIQAVETGHADLGFLPIENTSSGSINDVYDVLQHTSAAIIGEITIDVAHCLLVKEGTQLEDIRHVYSHPQPINQCSHYLSQQPQFKLHYCASSADAMAQVIASDAKDVAVIGHAEGGDLYGLTVLARQIANQQLNQSRFIIIGRKAVQVPMQVNAKTTLIMVTGQQAGALVDCLLVLKKYQLTMCKLESRPITGTPWEEMFYLDIEGNLDTEKMRAALEELKQQTRFLKVLGCYPCETVAPATLDQPSLNIEPSSSRQVTAAYQLRQFAIGQDKMANLVLLDKHNLQMPAAQLAMQLVELGVQGVVLPPHSAAQIQAFQQFNLCTILTVDAHSDFTQALQADVLFIDESQMDNNSLLIRLGGLPLPLMISRAPDADIGQLELAVQTVQQAGNRQIMIVESGFESKTGQRIFDIQQVQRLSQLGLPVLVLPHQQHILPLTALKQLMPHGIIFPLTQPEEYRAWLDAK